jgi:5-formyltetrahydrofolate cyclo-ligase
VTKDEIRAAKLAERVALPPDHQREAARAIAEYLWTLPEYLLAGALHVYLPIRGEVDTRPIIERAWTEGKKVVVPVVEPGNREMKHVLYTRSTPLHEGAYGIPQPVGTHALTLEELVTMKPLVLVPVVAVSRRLYRIGYGKGYYDQFLAQVPFRRIGLAYAQQFVDEFPVDEHDVPLDVVVTELGVVRR